VRRTDCARKPLCSTWAGWREFELADVETLVLQGPPTGRGVRADRTTLSFKESMENGGVSLCTSQKMGLYCSF
jgi:hypothetical protein